MTDSAGHSPAASVMTQGNQFRRLGHSLKFSVYEVVEITTSACWRHSIPRNVINRGSPGPAPTKYTLPEQGSLFSYPSPDTRPLASLSACRTLSRSTVLSRSPAAMKRSNQPSGPGGPTAAKPNPPPRQPATRRHRPPVPPSRTRACSCLARRSTPRH